MFEFIKPTVDIDFVAQRKYWVWFSIVTVALSIVLFFTKGMNYGIDFTGGAEVEIQVPKTWDTGKVRDLVHDAGLEGSRVQSIGEPGASQYLIKAQGDEGSLNAVSGKIKGQLAKALQPGEYEILRSDVVGPAAGAALRTSGFLSMLYSMIAILIYVTLRFDSRYSPGLIAATFHDTVLVIGVFVVTGKPFDLQILAAILALIGYSNNDTIVTFDRIRELAALQPSWSIEKLVNRAVNETLSRTILTSLTVILSVGALYFFGGKVIHDFAFALLVGLFVGIYSTIYVASDLLIRMTHRQLRKEARARGHKGSAPVRA